MANRGPEPGLRSQKEAWPVDQMNCHNHWSNSRSHSPFEINQEEESAEEYRRKNRGNMGAT